MSPGSGSPPPLPDQSRQPTVTGKQQSRQSPPADSLCATCHLLWLAGVLARSVQTPNRLLAGGVLRKQQSRQSPPADSLCAAHHLALARRRSGQFSPDTRLASGGRRTTQATVARWQRSLASNSRRQSPQADSSCATCHLALTCRPAFLLGQLRQPTVTGTQQSPPADSLCTTCHLALARRRPCQANPVGFWLAAYHAGNSRSLATITGK